MMKKLLFCFLAAALVLTSCSKDDSLPLPEVSKVEIIGATEGQMKITTGQTVGFSVECENVAIDRYEWIVNEKIESESVRFDFTPAQRGTYDISVNLYNADGGVTTKQIGELQVVDPAPVIASISCNDEALSDPVEVAVGTAVKLTVEVSNVEVASYVWTIDGDTVETATGATLDIPVSDRSGSLAVTVSAVNLDGIASEDSAFTVNFNGPYKNERPFMKKTFRPTAGTFFSIRGIREHARIRAFLPAYQQNERRILSRITSWRETATTG